MTEHPVCASKRTSTKTRRRSRRWAACFLAEDYLGVYERVSTDRPRVRLGPQRPLVRFRAGAHGRSRAAVSHCPASNAALGSGIFPHAPPRGSGLCIALSEPMWAAAPLRHAERRAAGLPDAKLANAEVRTCRLRTCFIWPRAPARKQLDWTMRFGDFEPGKSADFVYLKPPAGSPLSSVAEHAASAEGLLASIFYAGRRGERARNMGRRSVVYRNDDLSRN